ncbi:MAG: DUF1573 domain-containing protein [Planctomycetes bacterium]|nr:DUF1573 domain-containing protein [Planctomycetota bacterium]
MQSTLRYAVALIVLVAIVGSIAWLVQYLPSRTQIQPTGPTKPDAEKRRLAFLRDVTADGRTITIALWGKTYAEVKKDTSPNAKDAFPFKFVETGDRGFYDFLFKNTSDADVEIISYFSSCDCTGVEACSVSNTAWETLAKAHKEKPAEPLEYSEKPSWKKLHLDRNRDGTPEQKPDLIIKPNEGGVIRVHWNVNKSAGSPFGIEPMILHRAVGSAVVDQRTMLGIPIKIVPPIQFDRPRVELRSLRRGESASHTFIAWSMTRPAVDFALVPPSAEPLFDIKVTPVTGEDLEAHRQELLNRQLTTTATCAYRVTVTAFESKGDVQLEQGIFYRKWPLRIDGKIDVASPLWGPEIFGRVEEEVAVGGTYDQGKIRFGAVNIRETNAIKQVPLAAPAGMELELYKDKNGNLHPHQPRWIEVFLSRDKDQESKTRTKWLLEVEIRRNAKGATSFAEPDAVVLRAKGTNRLVRIPLDGHISR